MQNNATTADPFEREQPPLLIVISGPSGVGKDSVVQRMQERGFPFHFVAVSYTHLTLPTKEDEWRSRWSPCQ